MHINGTPGVNDVFALVTMTNDIPKCYSKEIEHEQAMLPR